MIILTGFFFFFSLKPSIPGLTQDLAKVERAWVEEPVLEMRQLQQAQSWMGEAGSREGAKPNTGRFPKAEQQRAEGGTQRRCHAAEPENHGGDAANSGQ